MMTREMFERLSIVALFLCFLLFGLIMSGKIGKSEDYKPSYLPVPKEIQYIIMTKEEYEEMQKGCVK